MERGEDASDFLQSIATGRTTGREAERVVETMRQNLYVPAVGPVVQAWGCYAAVCLSLKPDGLRRLVGAGAVEQTALAGRMFLDEPGVLRSAVKALHAMTLPTTPQPEAVVHEARIRARGVCALEVAFYAMLAQPRDHCATVAALGIVHALTPDEASRNRILVRAGILDTAIRELRRVPAGGITAITCLALVQRLARYDQHVMCDARLLSVLRGMRRRHHICAIRHAASGLYKSLRTAGRNHYVG